MDEDLRQYLDEKFRDIDEAVAATEQRLVSRVDQTDRNTATMEDRLLGRMTAMEQRLRDHTEAVETRLLTEFLQVGPDRRCPVPPGAFDSRVAR